MPGRQGTRRKQPSSSLSRSTRHRHPAPTGSRRGAPGRKGAFRQRSTSHSRRTESDRMARTPRNPQIKLHKKSRVLEFVREGNLQAAVRIPERLFALGRSAATVPARKAADGNEGSGHKTRPVGHTRSRPSSPTGKYGDLIVDLCTSACGRTRLAALQRTHSRKRERPARRGGVAAAETARVPMTNGGATGNPDARASRGVDTALRPRCRVGGIGIQPSRML